MRYIALFVFVALGLGAQAPRAPQSTDDLARQVRETERTFARALASRDFKAFGDLVSDEAVFFGRQGAQRGKAAVGGGK